MQPLYHIARQRDLPSIRKHGLVPQLGPRSTDARESVPAVFLFSDYQALEDGAEWYMELFPDNEPLVCLEIRLPPSYQEALLCDPLTGWETQCRTNIPWKYITVKYI